MKNLYDSPKKVMNFDEHSSHYFTNLASLPDSILIWIEQNMNNIILVTNDVGEIVYITESIKSFLGHEPTSLLGVTWNHFFSDEDIENFKMLIDDFTDDRGTLLLNMPDRKGKNIPFECTIKKVEHEEKVLYLSILKDITNKQEAEEMMVRSEKMSVAGQLAAGIAHEIRNPLTSLKGFLQLLQAGVDQKEAYYKIMIDEIDKIETITSELLFISKPLTNHKSYESLNDMISDVLVLLQPQANLRDVKLKWTNKDAVFIYCDRSQIKQVFINLVKNAIEASNDSGTVEVNIQSTANKVLIDIIDEGVGISEEIIHKLDEPFFTTKQTGTGLGLMITKNILNHHQAKIEIIQNQHKGSTFRIHFPVGE